MRTKQLTFDKVYRQNTNILGSLMSLRTVSIVPHTKNPALLRHKNIKLNNGCMWLPAFSFTGSIVTLYQSHPSAKVLVTTRSFGKPKWKRLLAVMKHGCIIWAGESESVLLLTGFCDFHSFHRTILKCNSKEGKIINSEE